MTDPEQRFLQARQARLTALANNTRKTEEDRHALADFWTALRLRFQNWKERLQQDGLDRQACLDLKEELQALRQECLHPNPHPSSILPVPMNLPAADWRVLHSEFTRYFALWEEVYTTKFPKGKFTFARYRQEVARRKALGIPLEAASAPTLPNPSSPTHQVEEQKDDDATLQDISNAAIYISTDGAVVVNSKDVVDSDQSQETGATTRSALLSSSAILLRRISNATIQIDKPLEALHLVDLTQVVITLAHPVASSIHVTHCQDCQVVPTKCQQLRIHESVRLDFQQVLLGAGAILEASEDILFGVVDDTTVLDVKDFHWLRTGVPSPNFRIVFAESSKVVEDQKAEESISTPASSVEQLAEQIETCSIQVDSSSPNIPPAKDADNSDDEDDEL